MSSKDAISLLLEEKTLPEPLFEPWLRKGDRLMLFAQSGLGKSWVSLKMAHSLCSGATFLKWKPNKKLKCVYFDGEMGEEQISHVFDKIENGADERLLGGQMRFCTPTKETDFQLPDLSSPAGQAWYDKESEFADLIVIDNLLTCSRLQGPRDDDFRQWERIQPWVIKKSLEGVTVALIHHSGKSGDQLGTSRREVMLNTVIKLAPPRGFNFDIEEGSKFEWHWKKKRSFSGEDAEPLLISHFTSTDNAQCWSSKSLKEHQRHEFERLYYKYGMQGAQAMMGLSPGEAQALKGLVINNQPKEEDEDDLF